MCLSSLFCQRQNPVLPQYKTLTIVLFRLQKTKKWPESGLRRRVSSTKIDRVLIALRMSVLPGARKTRKFAGKVIIATVKSAQLAQSLPSQIPYRFRYGSAHLQVKAAGPGLGAKMVTGKCLQCEAPPTQSYNQGYLFFFSNGESSLC